MLPQEHEEELAKLKQQKQEYDQKMEEIGKLQLEKKVREYKIWLTVACRVGTAKMCYAVLHDCVLSLLSGV